MKLIAAAKIGRRTRLRFVRILAALPRSLRVLLAIPAALFTQRIAQACPMCYQNAEASGAQGVTALRHGIFVLFLPAVGLFVGVFILIYRRRNAAR